MYKILLKVKKERKKERNNYHGSHKSKNTKQPFYFLRPQVQNVLKPAVYSFNVITLTDFESFFSWKRPTYIGSVIIYYSCEPCINTV